MNPVVLVALTLIIAVGSHHARMHFRAARHSRNTAPADDMGRKAAAYAAAKHRDALIYGVASTILLSWLCLGGAAKVHELVDTTRHDDLYDVVKVCVAMMGLFHLFAFPFSVWQTFGTERKFGFNRTTVSALLIRCMSIFYLGALITGGLTLFVAYVHTLDPVFGWIWAVPGLLLLVFAKEYLRPLNTDSAEHFTRLKDPSLNERLSRLSARAGIGNPDIHLFKSDKITTHLNAFIKGVGRGKKIVLFNTLTEKLTEAEIEAVVAHEIGHHIRHHVPIRLLLLVVSRTPLLMLAWALASNASAVKAFGFDVPDGATPTFSMVVAIHMFISGPILYWITPLMSTLCRRQEYEADGEAARLIGGKTDLVSALRKLYSNNCEESAPCPEYARFNSSHPTMDEREASLNRD